MVVAVCPVRSQDDGLIKILGAVDEKQRLQFARRLQLFMDHQRKGEWDELYKLIDKVNAEHWRGKDFAKMMVRFGHIDFVPERSQADDDHGLQYRVYGCVKVGREKNQSGFREAWLRTYKKAIGTSPPISCNMISAARSNARA